MNVANEQVLTKAGRRNASLCKALDAWVRTAQAATWRNFQDVKKSFPAVSGVPVAVRGGIQTVALVFNIRHNEYRLITQIEYAKSNILVRELLTHAEYDRNQWKGRLQ